MPALSFRLPRFLRAHRSRRSHSPKPSLAGAHDDAATSVSPLPGLSSASSSCPPSTQGAPERAVDASTGISSSLAPRALTQSQNSTDHLCVDKLLGNSSSLPSQGSTPITPINVVTTNSGPKSSPQNSVAQPSIHLPHVPDFAETTHSSCSLATPSQQLLVPGRQSPSGEDLPLRQNQNRGMFYQAHSLSATGNFIDGNVGNVTYNFNTSNNFMKDLLQETIPGAAADSSARDPPPRCHPGTRLAILERCLYFIVHCNGVQKMRWVVGAAGVGKSAIMQNVAESPQLVVASNASVFFSITGRSDGTKTIMTLSYQFAAKSDLYRQVIKDQVSRDPALLQSSMSIQFEKLLVQPFIHNSDLNTAGRVLVIIDGLDECNNTRTQVELLRLISNFCISYPSSPIVWLIASRPEPHITAFFSRPEVVPTYEKEEIAVDSDEARADVERFLRHEMTEIRMASNFLDPQWPDEQDLWKLASAAGGLFAYAQTVIRYIGDSNIGDPVSQLSDVLNVIDGFLMANVPQDQHPMAQLDALYARILSNIPPKIMINVRKLLLLLASSWDVALSKSRYGKNLIVMSNWLGMTADEAYAALNRLRSVVDFPQRDEAHKKVPRPFHKSLIDYLFRSGIFGSIKLEARQIKSQCTFRVLEEASDGIDLGNVDYDFRYGGLARNGNTGDKISICWCADEGFDWDDDKTRLSMYKLAIGEVTAGMKRGRPAFQSVSCIKLLTTRFRYYCDQFPCLELRDFVFDKSRCHNFMRHGILKQIPIKAIYVSKFGGIFDIKLQFRRPVATMTLLDPWNSSCGHDRVGQWQQGKKQNWTTVFTGNRCTFCFERLKHQFQSLINRHPDHVVLVMPASMEDSCVEFRFVDPADEVSEWTYWIWLWNSSELRTSHPLYNTTIDY